MKAKNFALMIASVLILVLLAGFASAALTVVDKTITNADDNTVTITVTNTGATALTGIDLTDTGDFDIDTESIAPFDLTAAGTTGASITKTINIITDLNTLDLGTHEITITATSGSVSDTGRLTFDNNEFCEFNNPNSNIRINIEDITNKGIINQEVPTQFGDDDKWYPLETIEVEVKVENRGNDDIDNIEVEWGLYNPRINEWFIDDSEKSFDLRDSDDDTLTIKFALDGNIDELEDGEYVFYVRATGDDTDNADQTICASDSEKVDVVLERDLVVLDNIKFLESAQCGSSSQITADVWNIGDKDQDSVSVRVFIDELNINQIVDVGDINSLDKEKLSVTLDIPEDADAKTYALKFTVYDKDNDIYANDDEDSIFEAPFKVEGTCGTPLPKATISATLESEATAGKELTVRATITNTGTELATYTISATNYAGWASSAIIDQEKLALSTGQSKDVLMKFNVNKDAEGEQLFDIKVLSSDGETILSQPVSLTIAKAGFRFGITGAAISSDNWYLWGIGALNIILVIIIIIIAIRVARS